VPFVIGRNVVHADGGQSPKWGAGPSTALDREIAMSSPFHSGEVIAQELAGVRKAADRVGAIIRDSIPPAAQDFMLEQPMALIGFEDSEDHIWCSVVTGRPGFLWAVDDRTVQIDAAARRGDPLNGLVEEGRYPGLLAIDPATRRRMRINGRVHWTDAGDFQIAADQVYSNCSKYIQAREWTEAMEAGDSSPGSTTAELVDSQITLIRNADTFFIASIHAEQGADCSHRGGAPGFVKVINNKTLLFADYAGNNMFNTLGNLIVNPRCGLLFIDFGTARTLQLTGRASVKSAEQALWTTAGSEGRSDTELGAQRAVEFQIDGVIELAEPIPLQWTFLEASPFNPS